MIICFNCEKRTQAILDRLVESGQYEDYTEAIVAALDAFSVLQSEVDDRGVLILSEREPDQGASSPRSALAKSALRSSANASLGSSPKPTAWSVPALFRLEDMGKMPSTVPELPDDVWARNERVPLDRWVFGQFNKLLPAKANCRALAHLLADSPRGIPIDTAPEFIASAALDLGDYLRHLDEVTGATRDDTLATAFPVSGQGPKTEKSRLRYASQFVASVNKHGQMSGLLIDFKLINQTTERKPRILLTEPGWQFAELKNPVLDTEPGGNGSKFSPAEREFLMDHVATSVPAEDFAYRTILTMIGDGTNTPDDIDRALRKFVDNIDGRSLSDSFLSSQRSGAISRMSDLEMIKRIRDGVRVSYEVTDTGRTYLQTV